MSSSWNKVSDILLSGISILAAIWIVILVFPFSREQGSTPEIQQVEDSLHETYPLTKMELVETSRDLGEVRKGELIRVSFSIKNVGQETLVITGIHPDCSCTDYQLSRREIPAGGMSELTLEIDTEHKDGPQRIQVVIDSNTEEGFHILKIAFDVIASASSLSHVLS